MKVHYLSICVCGKDDQRYSIVFNVKNICFLISARHLTFTIIFYYHVVMNTFIQWQETISDAYLTYTPSYFPFIEPNALVIVMTLGGGGTRDRPGSFVKEHVTHQRLFVILRFPAGGKFAITAQVEILVIFSQNRSIL